MSKHVPVAVIWNPSKHSTAMAEQVLPLLLEVPNVSVHRPESPEAAHELIQFLSETPGMIVAAGGDGTVRATVDSMMSVKSQRTLGVLPLGTGNDLARSLSIPFDAAGAVDVLTSGRVHSLDVMEFQTDRQRGWSANMITGGNTGRYLEVMTDEVKQRWGVLCYLRGVVDVIQNLEAFEISLTLDDGPAEKLSVLNVFLANGRTSGGGLIVSPDAAVDDGLIDVMLVLDGDPGEIAGLTANYLLADFQQHDLIVIRRARQVLIESAPPFLLSADGDSIGATPLQVQLYPQSLNVLVGPEFNAFARSVS
ncbi:diacylglycerol/lipid kinase family protein [Planctomicrobium sp. SH661]|uniref:diacylglycerol/lipid kinase family protein n=1 Tax=Planctomicrobium sp. SH661 TaxID=3448124 RepID=UPI003F5BDF37